MLKIENLSYSYPNKDLYENISFTLEEGQHGAFIGTNGSGKSTLIDMIIDTDKYMYDGILENSFNTIGYVSQFSETEKLKDTTVFNYIGEEFIKLQNEIADICTEMGTSEDIEPLLEKYQEALDRQEAINGDNFENMIDKNLNLANLESFKNSLISELSGGEFKLIQVIKSMIISPDLLVMDEPDVFLDFENLNALKNLINAHKGTLLVVTHNRYLLNHCFNKIIHLENKDIQEFEGNFIDYNFALLENKIETQELATADTLEIERNDAIVDNLRELATENAEGFRGRALRARVKIQERLEKRRIKEPFLAIKEPNIYLSTGDVFEGESLLEATNYNLAFDKTLLENVNFSIRGGEKIAIVGPNGTGKTSLLREIFKNNNSAISINENTKVGYLSQIQNETLNENNTIFEEFFDYGFTTRDEITEHVLEYGFEGEILNQKIGSLSGGEKNMLQLAKLSASDCNLLILDEPMSHLDLYSQISLEKALKNYNGAILMVSHEFYSIVNCMDSVLIIKDKKIKKIDIAAFRALIYNNHFSKDYLKIEEKKKSLETQIELALKEKNFEYAQELAERLEPLIKLL